MANRYKRGHCLIEFYTAKGVKAMYEKDCDFSEFLEMVKRANRLANKPMRDEKMGFTASYSFGSGTVIEPKTDE